MTQSCQVVFEELTSQISNLTFRRSYGDSKLIEKALDDLNALNYRYPVAIQHKAVLLINQLCSLVYPDNGGLVSKCCRLIVTLVAKQHVKVEGKTCSIVIGWCLVALKKNASDGDVASMVLNALKVLLRSSKEHVHNFSGEIINKDSIVIKLSKNEKNLQTKLVAIQCLEACTAYLDQSKVDKKQLIGLLKIFNENLLKNHGYEESIKSGILLSCLGGFRNLLSHNSDYIQEEIGIVFGIIRSYMVYRIEGVEFVVPQKLMPTVSSIPEPRGYLIQEKGGKVTKQRVSKKRLQKTEDEDIDEFNSSMFQPTIPSLGNEENSSKSFTDSEASDAETSGLVKPNLVKLQLKIRSAALNTFTDVTKIAYRRTLFSFIVNFLSDGFPVSLTSLNSCALRDPSAECRTAALRALDSLLIKCKLYLRQVASERNSSPFTPFSETIGAILVVLHRCLRLGLNTRHIGVLKYVLKCFSSLVQATPYGKLKKGLFARTVKSLKPFLYDRNPKISELTLIVFGCLLASEPATPESIKVFFKYDDFDVSKEIDSSESIKAFEDSEDFVDLSSGEEEVSEKSKTLIPWILLICLENLGLKIDPNGECLVEGGSHSVEVRKESLQTISAMCRHYFGSFIVPNLTYIGKALEISLSHRHREVKLYSGRSIYFIGVEMYQCLHTTNRNLTSSPNLISPVNLTIERGLSFWNSLLSGPLSNLIENKSEACRLCACDCLGSIVEKIFNWLSKDKQMTIMMTLLAFSRDSERSVAGAALRSLGIVIRYEVCRSSSGFVQDSIEAFLRGAADADSWLKARAYWALGNLSESLMFPSDDPEAIPDLVWARLFECALRAEVGPKLRTNAVRALGNFVYLQTDETRKPLVDRSIAYVLECAGSENLPKVRWNACYAIGRIVANPSIYASDVSWRPRVFEILSEIVVNCNNFKVRIGAASALAAFPSRLSYGNFYVSTWKMLARALENSENMEDFSEYQHRDQLVNQICLTVARLCVILEPSDLNALSDYANASAEPLKLNLKKVYARLVPEQSCAILKAEAHLRQTIDARDLTNEQSDAARTLLNVFNVG